MTNERAIQILENLIGITGDIIIGDEDREALEMAIRSLQQEQQEIDLEKDVESWFFNGISSKINVEHTMYYYFQECARRYFELGKNSK